MIIGSDAPLPIGFRGVGLVDAQHTYHPDQPFVVLRAATHAEWLAELPEDRRALPHNQAGKSGAYYYEVRVD